MSADDPASKRKVTYQELLEIRERQWRPRAEAVSLAAETLDSIPVHRREQALEAFGRLQDRFGPGSARERLLRRYPAVHVLATAGFAAEHYERGTFWPKLIAVLDIAPDPAFQSAWGDAFLDNLRTLGLPTFEKDDDAGSRYVGRILLHAGIPTYCLADFFRILSWKRSHTPGLTPEEFVSWAAAKAAGPGFQSLDMPVQRFVRYGDEFAVDVADRAFELLDAVAAGGPHDEVLLPQRFWTVAQELVDRSGIERPADHRPSDTAKIDIRPRLVLDPFGLGLLLRLPPVGDAPDGRAVWVVNLDDDVQRVATESLWPGSTEPAPQTDVAITKPVRMASVALAGSEHLQLPVLVVNDEDPLLVFGEDGELLPNGLPLPATKLWLLFPGEPESLQVMGTIPVLAESPLPPRWSGFSLVQVDLSGITAVSVGGSTRTVRKFESARVETALPVRGLRTTSGLPVVAQLPRLSIPSSMANSVWDVTLHDSAGEVIARTRLTGTEDPNKIWDEVPRPVVGTFAVRIRGPWGRGATRSFTVVEGVSVSFAPAWRRFVSGGLQPCIAQVRAADGINLSRRQLEFSQRDREQTLRVGLDSKFRSLVVSPPHMTVAYQTDAFTINPSVRPLTLMREDLCDSPGELILDIGASAQPVLHLIAGGRTLQTLQARSARAGVYHFNLAGIVDTLRDQPQASLALSDDGELVVATVRPRALFGSIELDSRELKFTDCINVDGLTAYVFPTRAPWIEPASLPIADGKASLPDWLIDAGPMRVVVRIEDPWVPLPMPEWPQPGTSTFVDADGWVIGNDQEETAVSMFLAGISQLPERITDFVRLWTARSHLSALGLGSRVEEVSKAIDAAVYAEPAAALGALTNAEVSGDSIPCLMIRTGLAWANLADAHENAAPPWTMRGAIPAALLSAADSVWSDQEIEAAISICGESVTGLLDGCDPHPAAGRMDESADLLDQEPSLREQYIKQASLIPNGLLSAESRVLAAMELVEKRRHPSLEWLMKHAHSVLREGERLIRIIGDPATQAAFDARRHHARSGGWHVVPAISMALALGARHASRGHVEASRWMIREQRPWADLAAVVPQLVTIDLIIAELVVGRRAGKEEEMESA
nr:hypothetical protein [Mycolicibacterium komanii]CRL70025.1 hypothetical protein CPGR_01807 [Mycolicibacterium komanii]